MKIRLPLPILLATILAFSQTSQAWDALGHMIVAQIAYDQLSPEAKPKFDTAAAEFSKEKAGDRSVADAAYCPASSGCWMDDIRSLPDKYSQLSPWHYVELPFNEDGTPQPGMNRGDRLQSDRGHGLHI
ncbi:MAG: S1/P1 nuclease, partial [bacterium]